MNAYQLIQGPQIDWPPPIPQPRYPATQRPQTHFDLRPPLELSSELGNQRDVPCLVILDELHKHYVHSSDSSVSTFLSQHPGISAILLDAIPHLKKHFGASAIFSLSAPVDEAGMRSLCAVVIWPGNIRDVRNALDRFDKDWWLSQSRMAYGHLVFTYELI